MSQQSPGRAKLASKIELRNVESLTLHPQHAVFAPPTEHEIDRLAEDICRRGMQHPIDITPDGTIIAGQKRWQAVKALGQHQIRCRVRVDLAEKGEAAIVEHLLADNLHRRQLSDLEQARAFDALRKLSTHPRGQSGGELRDELARHFGRSGRNMDRLTRVLKTPREVQDAFEKKRLTLVQASGIAGLPEKDQQAIAQAIQAGKCPMAALTAVTGSKSMRPAVMNSTPPAGPKELLQQLVQATGKLKQAADVNRDMLPATLLPVVRKVVEQLDAIYELSVKANNGRRT